MDPIKDTDILRAQIYGLLGALLAGPPAGDLLARLENIEDQSAPETELAQAWQQLKAAGRRADASLLDDEFHELFIGLGRGELVPYGCWYQTGEMMDRSLARLRSDLINLGIKRRSGVGETEDHAGALCETMAIICSPLAEIGLEIQKAFFSKHITGWMNRFFKDMQRASSADFYRAVGRLGEAFMNFENIYMDLSLPDV